METFGHKAVKDRSNSSKENTESSTGRGLSRVGVVRSVPSEGSPSRRVRPIPPPRTGNAAPAAVANRGNRVGIPQNQPVPARFGNVGQNLGGGDGSTVRVNASHIVAGHGSIGDDYERKVEDTLEGACHAFEELDAALRTMPRPRTQWYVDLP